MSKACQEIDSAARFRDQVLAVLTYLRESDSPSLVEVIQVLLHCLGYLGLLHQVLAVLAHGVYLNLVGLHGFQFDLETHSFTDFTFEILW